MLLHAWLSNSINVCMVEDLAELLPEAHQSPFPPAPSLHFLLFFFIKKIVAHLEHLQNALN